MGGIFDKYQNRYGFRTLINGFNRNFKATNKFEIVDRAKAKGKFELIDGELLHQNDINEQINPSQLTYQGGYKYYALGDRVPVIYSNDWGMT